MHDDGNEDGGTIWPEGRLSEVIAAILLMLGIIGGLYLLSLSLSPSPG